METKLHLGSDRIVSDLYRLAFCPMSNSRVHWIQNIHKNLIVNENEINLSLFQELQEICKIPIDEFTLWSIGESPDKISKNQINVAYSMIIAFVNNLKDKQTISYLELYNLLESIGF